jgi:hypothetical protein
MSQAAFVYPMVAMMQSWTTVSEVFHFGYAENATIAVLSNPGLPNGAVLTAVEMLVYAPSWFSF